MRWYQSILLKMTAMIEIGSIRIDIYDIRLENGIKYTDTIRHIAQRESILFIHRIHHHISTFATRLTYDRSQE